MQAVAAHSSTTTAARAGLINPGLKGLILALAVAFLGVIGWNLRDTTVHEGDRPPDFAVRTDQGREMTPVNFGGKVLVLNFWATWCTPCITETPSLSAFERKYRDKGVVVLGISIDKNDQKYKRFLQRFQIAFDTYRDPNATISSNFGTFQIPETYVIKNGRVLRKYISDQNWMSDEVDHYVESLL
jgi:cytochrome c biogenesis protein CcmG, thiol:disulfide interchange protein DsbE